MPILKPVVKLKRQTENKSMKDAFLQIQITPLTYTYFPVCVHSNPMNERGEVDLTNVSASEPSKTKISFYKCREDLLRFITPLWEKIVELEKLLKDFKELENKLENMDRIEFLSDFYGGRYSMMGHLIWRKGFLVGVYDGLISESPTEIDGGCCTGKVVIIRRKNGSSIRVPSSRLNGEIFKRITDSYQSHSADTQRFVDLTRQIPQRQTEVEAEINVAVEHLTNYFDRYPRDQLDAEVAMVLLNINADITYRCFYFCNIFSGCLEAMSSGLASILFPAWCCCKDPRAELIESLSKQTLRIIASESKSYLSQKKMSRQKAMKQAYMGCMKLAYESK